MYKKKNEKKKIKFLIDKKLHKNYTNRILKDFLSHLLK